MNKMIWFKHIWLKQLSQVRKDLEMISNFSHLEVVKVEVEEDKGEVFEEVDQELEMAHLNAKCVENLVMRLGIAITDSIKISQILSNLRLSKILLHLLLAFTIHVLILPPQIMLPLLHQLLIRVGILIQEQLIT